VTTALDESTRELVLIFTEARHRVREREDPAYRRPSLAQERLADLEQRLLVVRASRGDDAAVRTIAEQQLEVDELIREAKTRNAVEVAVIRAEAEEEEVLQW